MSSNGNNKRELLVQLLESKDKSLTRNDIAVVGVSGRYPMAETLDQFWDNLCRGRHCISEVPSDRWNWRDHIDETLSDGKYTYKWGGFIKDVDKFDPQFFNISPREAEHIDPQERLFLQTAWHTLEDAGYTPKELVRQCGEVGVFAGVMNSNYAILGSSLWSQAGKQKQYPCNASFWSIANRVSYCFDFSGPSLSIDSACSSSLTAVHLACESIKRGECGAAIAGGVNLILHPAQLYNLALMNMISANGRCASFGEGADGFVDGEGVGAVLLKPLYKAIANGDHVYAVIKGGSINSGGKTSGFTVPNPNAQAELIRKVIKLSNIDPRAISYIEAHGTGTSLGDPIELRGLTKALEASDGDKPFCALGSVKSNIGHLESAAGISGLTKILLQMKYNTLVPSVNSEPQNPHVNLDGTPFFIQKQKEEWSGGECKVAGISSFGAGGANAHLILESYPDRGAVMDDVVSPQLILLSAREEEQLREYCKNFCDFIDKRASDIALPALAYTLIVGREAFQQRLAVVTFSLGELRNTLQRYLNGERDIEQLYLDRVPKNKTIAASSQFDVVDSLNRLAQAWVGGTIDKDNPVFFYDGLSAKRISLPTYPFLKERYWLEPQDDNVRSSVTEELPPAEAQTDDIDLKYMLPQWRQCPLPIKQASLGYHTTVVFYDENSKSKLYDDFASAAERPVLVSMGTEFSTTGTDRYSINPADKETFVSLFRSLHDANRAIEHIIFISPAAIHGGAMVENGIQALLHLTQVLIQEKLDKDTRILIWTNEEGDTSTYATALAGFVKTIRIERPNLRINQVIVTSSEDNSGLSLKHVQTELLTDNDSSAVIKYENGRRLGECLIEMPIKADDIQDALKPGGVYLITGGAGGLGRIFAMHIARKGGMRLVLTGRSPIDEEKQAFVDSLKENDNEVVYFSCDVADRTAVEVLFEKIRSRFTRIDGIIHSAGVLKDAYITNKTWDAFKQVTSAKIDGVINLDSVSADDQLDFFVAFSSITSVIGNMGQSDYAYANGFIDRFCLERQRLCQSGQRSGVSLSINWPLWNDTGMTVSETVLKSLEKNIGIVPLPPSAGLDAFEAVLVNATSAQVIPIYGYQHRIRAFLAKQQLIDTKVEQDSIRRESITPASLAVVACADKRSPQLAVQIENTLKKLVSEVLKLKVERIDLDEILNDLGFDSISLTELVKRLQQSLNVELSPAVLYTYNSITKLKAHLLNEHTSEIVSAFEQTQAKPACDAQPGAAVEAVITPAPVSYAASDREKVAIVGVSCIFPGAEDIDAFWSNLINNKDTVSEIPVQRWRWQDYYGDTFGSANKMNSKWGAFIPDVEYFDYAFFNIPEQEALYMDPQHRLFLQTVWKAIEDSGHKISELRKKAVGVFAGVEFSDYRDLLEQYSDMRPEIPIGNALNMIPNRVSYTFDFTGPSEAIDTACSGSLVAVNRAVRSIQCGESDIAIAGGVSLTLSPTTMIGTSQLNIYSPDGKCKTFDATANGYVKGEGIAAVVLKPLSAAMADGDNIYGVIKGIAVNHGGKSNSITAPNPEAQARLLVKAYQEADVDPQRVSYIEMHGTGTNLGDPIEIEGLKSAFKQLARLRGKPVDKQHFCGIGSVKTNIGHLEPVSGMAGLFKVLLSMREGQLPRNLHFNKLNPAIHIKDTPFFVVDKAQKWHRQTGANGEALPYIAGVSSFGFGGSNAHVVIEEYRGADVQTETVEPQVLVLSTMNQAQLKFYATSMLNYLMTEIAHKRSFRDIIYTLQLGREPMAERLAFVTNDLEDCIRTLEKYLSDTADLENLYQGNINRTNEVSADLIDRDMTNLLIAKRNTRLLAKWWTLGADIEWSGLYHEQPGCRRVPLPTYPFERKRCWLDLDRDKCAVQLAPGRSTLGAQASVPVDNKVDTRPQSPVAPLPGDQPFVRLVLTKIAQLTGRDIGNLDHNLHLEYDLALDSIKMMGLINELMSAVDKHQLPYFNRLGMNGIISQAQTIGKLIEVFQNAGADAKSTTTAVKTDFATENSLAMLDAQYLFLPAYFLTNSSSLCSYIKLKGKIDKKIASQAWNDLIAHHPMLRTCFHWPKTAASRFSDVECRLIEDPAPVDIEVTDLRSLTTSKKQLAVQTAFYEKLNRVWDLERWPLHEFSLYRTADQEYVLFWSNEHIISDGLSNQQALRDFLELYRLRASKRDEILPTYTTEAAYREVVSMIGDYRNEVEEQALSSYIAEQGRQGYFFNPENRTLTTEKLEFACIKKKLSKALTRKLTKLVKVNRVPMNSLLTSAYVKLISKYETNGQQIILQLPTSGRIYPGVEASHMIGCFAQNLSLSFDRATDGEALENILGRIHKTIENGLISAYDRSQTRQIGELVRNIVLGDGGVLQQHTKDMLLQNVKSNLYFPYIGHTNIDGEYGALQVSDYTAGTTNSPGSIDWLQEIFNDSLHIFVNYDAGFFDAAFIGRMIDDYVAILSDLVKLENVVQDSNHQQIESDPEILQRVLEVVCDTSHLSLTTDDVHKDMEAELGLDSLDKIRLITRLLTETGTNTAKGKLFSCRSISEIADVLLIREAGSPVADSQVKNDVNGSALMDPVAIGNDTGRLSLSDEQKRIPFCKFSLIAERQPESVAVINTDSSCVTYSELNRRSNQLAHYLKSLNIGKGDFVAIMSHRGSDMLAGIMGVLKTGAAYVPIDPSYPHSRIQYILNHAKIRILLTQSLLNEQIENIHGEKNKIEHVVYLDDIPDHENLLSRSQNWNVITKKEWVQKSERYPDINPSATDLMVILFTSGSTGNPKGVKLNHAGYINRLEWHQKIFDLKQGERVAQKTSCCFDISIWELFWPLMYGGTVCAVEREIVSNPWAFAEWIATHDINIAHFVPSSFGEFVNATETDKLELDSLRWLIFSGEALPTPVIQKWIDKYGLKIGLANLYGPTEASIDVTYHIIDRRPDDNESIPIGRAVDNTDIIVVSKECKRVERGQLGELCIGGVQLAEGYLNEPELTAKAFIDNPFTEITGDCIYKTGDLVKENDDGSIEYHGRLDSQIKIRGFRVELGEIESVLCLYENINEAAVLVVDLGQSKKLIAWVSGTGVDEKRIKAFVREKCPEYMVPHIVVIKDTLPKNHNGKLDRKALLAEFQSSQDSESADSAKNISNNTLVPIGPSQKWIFSYFDPPYNWWGYSHIKYNEQLDFDVFTMAINKVIDRHGALKTFFSNRDGEWMQVVLDDRPPFIPDFIDASGEQEQPEPKTIIDGMKQSITIGAWPLFKFTIVKYDSSRYDILMVGHHLISDYVSGRILFDELLKFYRDSLDNGEAADEKTVSVNLHHLYPHVFSYADFVRAVDTQVRDEQMEQYIAYWKKYDLGPKQCLKIPYDFEGGENLESSERKLVYKVTKMVSDKLRRDIRAHLNCSTYHLLLAPLYKFLSIELERPWIVLSHKMNGRNVDDDGNNFYQSIGNFAVNYPVGLHIDAGDDYEEIVKKLRAEFDAVPLSGLSYDWISDHLPESVYPDNKVAEIRVNYLGDMTLPPGHEFDFDREWVNQRLSSPDQLRTANIEIFIYSRGNHIFFDIAYSANLYKESTIDHFGKGYLRQIQGMTEAITDKT